MIKSNEEYESAKQALNDIEKAFIDLKKEVYPKNPERYQLMAEPYVNYIKKIRHDLDTYSGYSDALEKSIPLWIRIKGPHIGEGTIRASVLSNFLNDFKLGIQTIALYLSHDAYKEVGRPIEEIRKLSNFKATIQPGSLKIGISFPTYQAQATLDKKTIENPVKQSINKFLQAASWAITTNGKKIEAIFPNEKERKLILNQLDKISPKSEGEITDVEFKGSMVSKGYIKLNKKSTNKIKEAISKTVPPKEIIAEGTIREIDLDDQHFILRERPKNEASIRCQYDESLKENAIEGLDKRVRVVGNLIRDKLNKPRYIDITDIDILGSKEN